MLLFNFDQFLADPIHFLRLMAVTALALVIAITGHEASHALIATLQGDFTAKRLNRLSLNPMNHLDPAGTAMLFLVGFGWGKPVPVNPFWLKLGPKVGTALVALAGPVSNIAMASLFAIPVRLGLTAWHDQNIVRRFTDNSPGWLLADAISLVIFYNIVLAVFNLIPIAPLDGFKVALGVLPRNAARSFARLEPYGPGILMILLLLSYFPFFQIQPLAALSPVIRVISLLVVGRPL